MNFTIRFSFYFKQGTCLLSFALWWIALNLNQRECTVWFDLIRLICYADMKIFLYTQYKFFWYIFFGGYWVLESCPKCRLWGGRIMLRAHIHQEISLGYPPGVSYCLSNIISGNAQTGYDCYCYLRRSPSSNRSSKTSPLTNPKSQTKTFYLSVQANKLISKFKVLY